MNETELINFRKSLLGFKWIIANPYTYNSQVSSWESWVVFPLKENWGQTTCKHNKCKDHLGANITDIDSHIVSRIVSQPELTKLLKTKRQSGFNSSSKSGSEDNEYTKQEILTDQGFTIWNLNDVLALLTIQDYTDAVSPHAWISDIK